MRKKEWTYLLILVWVVFGIQLLVNVGISRDDQLVEAFHGMATIPVESDVEAYGYFGDMYLRAKTREQMLVNFAKKLGITEGYTLDSDEGDSYQKSVLIKDGAFGRTNLQMISIETTAQDGEACYQQYLYATITIYDSVEYVQYYRKELERIYEQIGMQADINVYLAGEVDGRMDITWRDQLADAFLKSMEAKEVYGTRTEELYTIYGYTRHEKEYVYQNGEKVNVNIAVTYDAEKDKTKIHMAVPFISKTY